MTRSDRLGRRSMNAAIVSVFKTINARDSDVTSYLGFCAQDDRTGKGSRKCGQFLTTAANSAGFVVISTDHAGCDVGVERRARWRTPSCEMVGLVENNDVTMLEQVR